MTEIEAAKRILKEGNCSGVDCTDCPASMQNSEGECSSKIGTNESGNKITPKGIEWFKRWLSEHEDPTPQGKPIDHFESGHWYKWVGPLVPAKAGISGDTGVAWTSGKAFLCNLANGVDARFVGLPVDCSLCYESIIESFIEVPDPTVHFQSMLVLPLPRSMLRSVNCRCSIVEAITDKIVGKSDDFDPASVKSRSQRRLEILCGLTID